MQPVNFLGYELEHPVMLGAGICKRADGWNGVVDWLRKPIAAVTLGSITVEPRSGNTGNTYYRETSSAGNSLGMPNPGIDETARTLPEMVEMAHRLGKRLGVNVAGFSPREYADLARVALEANADWVELNLSCPNVLDHEYHEPIPSYNDRAIDQILHVVGSVLPLDKNVGIKVSPLDPGALKRAAVVVKSHPLVKFVVATNTYPNAIFFDREGNNAITTNQNGYAGLSGEALKHISLGNVRQWRDELEGRIPIVGVGGIRRYRDVNDSLRAGATVTQVVTALLWSGNINQSMATLLDEE